MLADSFDLANIIDRSIWDKLIDLQSDPSKLYIFLCEFESLLPKTTKLWEYLSCDEQQKVSLYATSYLRERAIISRGLLRCILSLYCMAPPQALAICYNRYGKPFLPSSNIFFNVSHSHQILSYAICSGADIGVDVEFQHEYINYEELSTLLFTRQESARFSALHKREKLVFFYETWTQKEALVKACGIGLSYPLQAVETMGEVKKKLFYLKGALSNDTTTYWTCYPLSISKGYVGAVAKKHAISKIMYIRMNKTHSLFDTVDEFSLI